MDRVSLTPGWLKSFGQSWQKRLVLHRPALQSLEMDRPICCARSWARTRAPRTLQTKTISLKPVNHDERIRVRVPRTRERAGVCRSCAFLNPDAEDGKIHRLRGLHRFKKLEA